MYSHRQDNCRELAAKDSKEMEQWLEALQNAMDAADTGDNLPEHIDTPLTAIDSVARLVNSINAADTGKTARAPASTAPLPHRQGAFMLHQTVEQWLASLKLDHLLPTFISAGYTDMLMIQELGLNRDDFAYLGITGKAERRVLAAAARGVASGALTAGVSGFFSFDRETVFRVESQWRFLRAYTYFSLQSFEDLHKKMKGAMRDTKYAKILPSLPPKPAQPLLSLGNVDRAAQMAQLQQALHRYIQRVTAVVGTKEPFFTLLCGFLEILPWDERRLPDRSAELIAKITSLESPSPRACTPTMARSRDMRREGS
ncbi:hypothetical protein JKP88DRAFT_252684 [Tribonema minus]|uniref:PH domain-containing protein n=1 Tax=Tribonema minus TaxID=303371 RepID=A0A836CKQ6_9STRA|nr:hypothetical protein JKP88DRAFT_252684 [Tribonema minus]